MSNFFDFLNADVSEVQLNEPIKASKVLYSPNPNDSKTGVYEATIRFLANPKDHLNIQGGCIKEKQVYWIDCPAVGVKEYFDSPKTIGQQCLFNETFYKLKNKAEKQNDAIAKKNMDVLKWKVQYHSYVYIVEDLTNPENTGKIMIFRYNKTIFDLIMNEIEPSEIEIKKNGKIPTNIFNAFQGKDFYLKIKKKGNFPDYTECKFFNAITAISIDGKEVNRNNKEDMNKLKNLVENMPDISAYGDFTPLSDEKVEKVKKVCNFLLNSSESDDIETINTSSMNNVSKKTKVESESLPDEDTFDNSSDSYEDDDLEAFLKEMN